MMRWQVSKLVVGVCAGLITCGCQNLKGGAGDSGAKLLDASSGVQVCQIADVSLIDPGLMQHARAALTAAGAAGNEVWSLLADTDGLVVYTEIYDVLRSGAVGEFTYRKEDQSGSVLERSTVLTREQLAKFQERIAKADQLCNLNHPSFGGTKYHYLHLAKAEGGDVKVFAAFVAPNPEGAPQGDEHAGAVRVFTELAGELGL